MLLLLEVGLGVAAEDLSNEIILFQYSHVVIGLVLDADDGEQLVLVSVGYSQVCGAHWHDTGQVLFSFIFSNVLLQLLVDHTIPLLLIFNMLELL